MKTRYIKSIVISLFITLTIHSTAQYCGISLPCPDPSSAGYGKSSCPDRPCCNKVEGDWGSADCDIYTYQFEGTITQQAVIDGKNCFRQYNQYGEYKTHQSIQVMRCQYNDSGSGSCQTGNDFYQKITPGTAVYNQSCIDYLSVTPWQCGGILT